METSKTNVCKRCGKGLKSAKSRAAGIGPVCSWKQKAEADYLGKLKIARGKVAAGPSCVFR